MGDCMSYPETIEEFIKEYSFKDTEEIYTNGAELIPVFRVMQAIEHYIQAAEEHEQLSEWLEELKALRLLLDWAIECDFGLDSFPEEYEKYKHTLTDDMTYKDMMIQIAKCVVKEQLKERTEK